MDAPKVLDLFQNNDESRPETKMSFVDQKVKNDSLKWSEMEQDTNDPS